MTAIERDAERHGEPQRRRDHRLVPLRDHEPRHLQRQLRDARAGERRQLAGRGQLGGDLLAGDHRAEPGDDLLLLRDRLEQRAGPRSARWLSFTTPSAPTVTTAGRDLARPERRDPQRRRQPQRRDHHGLVPLGTTNPGTCNDSFGTRAPSSGGSSLGTGNSGVAFSRTTSGLTPGTTYYFCAIASNAERDIVRRGAVVHDAGGADGDDSGGDDRELKRGDPERRGDPQRRRRHRLVPLLRPRAPAPATTASGPARRSSGGSSLGARATRASRSPRPPAAFCPGRPTSSARSPRTRSAQSFGSVLSFTTPATAPVVTTSAATNRTGIERDAERHGEPQRRRDHRLVPLRDHEPRHLQRQLRDPRAVERRHALGARATRR